jgi:hypothetical protein
MGRRLALAGTLLAVGFAPAVSGPALGQGIRTTANTTETTIQDPIVLSVTVESATRVEPTLPELHDFRVVPRGHSTRVQIVGGRTSSSITYEYLLYPLRTGELTVGPATVVLDEETYSSRPFVVRVLEASAELSDSDYLFVRASVSNTEPFVGEQVLYTWRFYRRVRIGDARLESMDLGGLVAEDLGEVREYRTTVNGLEYVVSEIRKALFAQEAGEVTLPPTRLTCEVAVQAPRRRSVFDDFFGRIQTQTKTLTTAPITLRVRDLPDAPPGFSGLVGEFELRSAISKRGLQVGESTTLELTLEGSGNVFLMSEPALPVLADFKLYPDKPSSSVERTANGLEGKKTFRTALVPLRAGELVVPAVELTYFDPGAESYRRAATRDLVLDVQPAAGKEELMLTESVAPTTGKVAVKILADDILPIHRQLDAVESQMPTGVEARLWQAGFVLPPLCYVGFLLVRRRQERYATDTSLRRREGALRRANARLQQLGSSAAPRAELAREASRLLREYVGDKLAAEGAALTPGETCDLLRRRGVDDELVADVERLLTRFESAQYGSADVALEPSGLAQAVGALVRRLDRTLASRRRR